MEQLAYGETDGISRHEPIETWQWSVYWPWRPWRRKSGSCSKCEGTNKMQVEEQVQVQKKVQR